MKKTYVLDTNVLIQDPLALYKFDDNEVVIPDTVICLLYTSIVLSSTFNYFL